MTGQAPVAENRSVPGELRQIAVELFAALDALDVGGVMRWVSDDVQEVHELSRRWLRGGKSSGAEQKQGQQEKSVGISSCAVRRNAP